MGPGYPEEAFAGEAAAVAIFFAFFVEVKFVADEEAEVVFAEEIELEDAAAAGVGQADMADAGFVAAAVDFPAVAAAAVVVEEPFLSTRDLPLVLAALDEDALADFPTLEVGALVAAEMDAAREVLPLALPLVLPLTFALAGAGADTGGEAELEEEEPSSSWSSTDEEDDNDESFLGDELGRAAALAIAAAAAAAATEVERPVPSRECSSYLGVTSPGVALLEGSMDAAVTPLASTMPRPGIIGVEREFVETLGLAPNGKAEAPTREAEEVLGREAEDAPTNEPQLLAWA
jgi:hypothetical protein